MINIKTKEDIYPAISELITILERDDKQRHISNILKHRMYKVSWTTRSELFEELSRILINFIETDNHSLDETIVSQINKILKVIEQDAK